MLNIRVFGALGSVARPCIGGWSGALGLVARPSIRGWSGALGLASGAGPGLSALHPGLGQASRPCIRGCPGDPALHQGLAQGSRPCIRDRPGTLGPASGAGPGALGPASGSSTGLSALHPGVQHQKKNIREIFNTNSKIMKLCTMNGYGMLNISAKFQIKTP
jgi:hypothetical protein